MHADGYVYVSVTCAHAETQRLWVQHRTVPHQTAYRGGLDVPEVQDVGRGWAGAGGPQCSQFLVLYKLLGHQVFLRALALLCMHFKT